MNPIQISILSIFLLAFSCFASTQNSLSKAFTDGQFSGEAGLYYEASDFKRSSQESANNESYAHLWTQIRYKTAKWNNLQLGAQVLAAQDLYDDNAAADNKGYHQDFEGEDHIAFSELYLKYYFTEKSYILVGRYYNKKLTYLDDSHSEGAYISYQDIEDLTVTAGFMTQFAEFDYDDFEDFGRENGSQDLGDSDFYGDAANAVFFLDARYKANKNLDINGYIYYQDDYAAVLGSDLKYSHEFSETLSSGLKTSAYLVDDQRTTGEDNQNAFVASASPWIAISNIKLETGYTHFGKGLFKPRWFSDYILAFDQMGPYNTLGATDDGSMRAVHATATYKFKNFYAHYGIIKWDNDAENSIDTLDQELIFGYKVTKSTDLTLRFIESKFGDDSSSQGSSFQKIEARLRYKF